MRVLRQVTGTTGHITRKVPVGVKKSARVALYGLGVGTLVVLVGLLRLAVWFWQWLR